MNGKNEKDHDAYRSFLLMTELDKGDSPSQRELAKRLGVAVGLVNSYLKNFVAKGFVRVKNYPRNRYAYLLTPKGIAEKGRLALQHLDYFTGLYTQTRQDYLGLFQALKEQGVPRIAFCGVDEVAEIAYLSLKEAGLELGAVMDVAGERQELFGRPVMPLAEGISHASDRIVITSLKRGEGLYSALVRLGVGEDRILQRAGGGKRSIYLSSRKKHNR